MTKNKTLEQCQAFQRLPLPSKDVRLAIAESIHPEAKYLMPGEYVMLGFISDKSPLDGNPFRENMWVYVLRRNQNLNHNMTYTGLIDNHPEGVQATHGDIVHFGPSHVLDIYADGPDDDELSDGWMIDPF